MRCRRGIGPLEVEILRHPGRFLRVVEEVCGVFTHDHDDREVDGIPDVEIERASGKDIGDVRTVAVVGGVRVEERAVQGVVINMDVEGMEVKGWVDVGVGGIARQDGPDFFILDW